MARREFNVEMIFHLHVQDIRIFDTAASVSSLKLQNYQICFLMFIKNYFFVKSSPLSFINKQFPKQTSFLNHCIF